MDIFLTAFDDAPDPRVDNARHDPCELLVVAFVAVLGGATSSAGMADFGSVLPCFRAIAMWSTTGAISAPVRPIQSASTERPMIVSEDVVEFRTALAV